MLDSKYFSMSVVECIDTIIQFAVTEKYSKLFIGTFSGGYFLRENLDQRHFFSFRFFLEFFSTQSNSFAERITTPLGHSIEDNTYTALNLIDLECGIELEATGENWKNI